MAEALIVFTSLTGNTEEMADIIAERLEQHGVTTDVVEVLQADAEELLEYEAVLIGSYTYGVDGVLPDEMLDFYEDMGQLDLSDKVFGVFGSGDTFYEVFCAAVDHFEKQFINCGAQQGGTSCKINLNAEEEDIIKLHALADGIAEKLKAK
ncbi:flavodoxin [Facklamia lactis]|uniref:flavodoxin n=1 Tax=Facklamia lactis TaxID=2749967 RepID=UPI0018CF5A94|nr:flavodoxin [Facklamia lactis]MBG9980845.1 flavodoxin [Facklamia lactis]